MQNVDLNIYQVQKYMLIATNMDYGLQKLNNME